MNYAILDAKSDPKQSLRLRRFTLGALGYVIGFVLGGLCYLAGLMALEPILYALPVVLVLNGLLFAVLASGINLRFKDPSLTLPQLFLATAVMMYAAFASDESRSLFLLLYTVPFLFGAFRLSVREHIVVGLFALMCHAIVIAVAWHVRADSVRLGPELLEWATLGVVLAWLILIGHQLRTARHQARVDVLTGLPNRRIALSELDREQQRLDRGGPSYCVCFIDVDHFKQINDANGHEGGDSVLRHIARAVSEQLRGIDVFARFGGDEFLAVLPATTIEQGRVTCERLRTSVGALDFGDAALAAKISVSVGLTEARAGEAPNIVLARADAALYRAKQIGRNCVSHL